MLLSLDGIGLSARTDFVSDVADYLHGDRVNFPSRYFYDALGSALFDAICRLPWYQVTRAETALLARHARAMLEPLRRPLNITELGCGNGEKLAILLEKGGERLRRVHLIDISGAALASARARLATLPSMPVTAFKAPTNKAWRGSPPIAAMVIGSCCSSARTSATSIRPRRETCCAGSAAR